MKDLTEEARLKVLEKLLSELEGNAFDFNKLNALTKLLESLTNMPKCFKN